MRLHPREMPVPCLDLRLSRFVKKEVLHLRLALRPERCLGPEYLRVDDRRETGVGPAQSPQCCWQNIEGDYLLYCLAQVLRDPPRCLSPVHVVRRCSDHDLSVLS
jgi:hypothetical protein